MPWDNWTAERAFAIRANSDLRTAVTSTMPSTNEIDHTTFLSRILRWTVETLRESGLSWLPALRVRSHAFVPTGWPDGLKLRVALVADLHSCRRWMERDRIEGIVDRTNDLDADVVLLLGDYVSAIGNSPTIPTSEWVSPLARLRSRLGVFGILGNHDWWSDPVAQIRRAGPVQAQTALESVGIPVLDNGVARIEKDGHAVQIAGLGDQRALLVPGGAGGGRIGATSTADLPGVLAMLDDALPTILMAHEPDIFPKVPSSISLTVSGHTHGGQVRLLGWAPTGSSKLGMRYSRGHFVEAGRHLVVSAGLGCSRAPIRFGVPPEIVVLDLG